MYAVIETGGKQYKVSEGDVIYIEALDVPKEEVCYVAFTGKAATVLKQKGCPNAVTAHKLLYKAKPKSDGTFMFIPKGTDELSEYSLATTKPYVLVNSSQEAIISPFELYNPGMDFPQRVQVPD